MITFNGFNLNDGTNYIVRAINMGRGTATRGLDSADVSTREGIKYLGEEYRQKIITIIGTVYATTTTDFQTAIDDLKQNLAGVTKQLIIDDTGRYFIATASQVDISDEGAQITSADFSVTFTCELPFSIGSELTTSFTAVSGTNTFSQSITITGTAYARPVVTYNIPDGDGTGSTSISGITISHTESGNYVSWSGTSSSRPLTYSGQVSFNYNNATVNVRGTKEDFGGFFNIWEPGINNYIVTFSGLNVGGTINFSYNPRYY